MRELLTNCIELGHQSFPDFELELKHWLFLGLKPASFRLELTLSAILVLRPWTQTELHDQLSWVASLPTADLGTSQPPQSCEPVAYNKALYTHTHPYWFYFSRELRP